MFNSWNSTDYWDFQYHTGPCYSEQYSKKVVLNTTYKFDPQQEWGTAPNVRNGSNPIDYGDHFYISVRPVSTSTAKGNIEGLLQAATHIELKMFYSDKYEYVAPPEFGDGGEYSQAIVVFWLCVITTILICCARYTNKRKSKIMDFFKSMIMPTVEFKYREYQIEKKLKQHVSDAQRAIDDRTGEAQANDQREPLTGGAMNAHWKDDNELLNSPSGSEGNHDEHQDRVNELPSDKKKKSSKASLLN